MDNIDIQVLGGLLASTSRFGVRGAFRGLFRGIAKELGLDEDTVRKRVKSLQMNGLLGGWDIYLNPSAVGCRARSLRIDVDPSLDKENVVRKIGMVHGVLGVTDMIGSAVVVFLMYSNDLSLKKSTDLILGMTNGKVLFDYQTRQPVGALQLSSTDWKTIQALRRNPTSSYKVLGMAMGTTGRAAKRRVERLTQGAVVTVTPRVDFKAMQGAVAVDMIVSHRDPRYKDGLDSKIAARIGKRSFRVGWGDDHHSHYTFGVLGIAEAREIGDWVKTLDGVSAARLDFIYDQRIFSDTFDEYVTAGSPALSSDSP